MSAFMLVITLLLTVAFWRHVMAFLAAAVVLLVVLGIVYVVETMAIG